MKRSRTCGWSWREKTWAAANRSNEPDWMSVVETCNELRVFELEFWPSLFRFKGVAGVGLLANLRKHLGTSLKKGIVPDRFKEFLR